MLFVYSNTVTKNIHCDITCCSQYILLDGNIWYPFWRSTPRILFPSSTLRTKSVFLQVIFDIDFCFVLSYYQITFFKKFGSFGLFIFSSLKHIITNKILIFLTITDFYRKIFLLPFITFLVYAVFVFIFC